MAFRTAEDQQAALAELNRRAQLDLEVLWRAAGTQDYFAKWLQDAYPELAAQYAEMSAQMAAVWYEDAAPQLEYAATTAPAAPLARYEASVSWALNVGNELTALDLLAGSLQRAVFDGARETTIWNATAEPGAGWARHASANACAFCRMLTTRGAVYASEEIALRVGGRGKDVSSNFDQFGVRRRGGQAKGVRVRGKQKVGDKYHDSCHCTAYPIRPGEVWTPPDYVADWEQEYSDATAIARQKTRIKPLDRRSGQTIDMAGAGAGDLKDIMRIMREGPDKYTTSEWLEILERDNPHR